MCAFIWVLEIFGPIFCHVELVLLIILIWVYYWVLKKKIWAYYWHYFIICLTTCNCWVGTCYLFLYVSINDTTLLSTSNNLSFSSCEKIMKKVVTYYFTKPLSLTFPFHLFLHFGWTCFLSSYSFQCWIYGYLQVDFRMVTIMFWLIWNKES